MARVEFTCAVALTEDELRTAAGYGFEVMTHADLDGWAQRLPDYSTPDETDHEPN